MRFRTTILLLILAVTPLSAATIDTVAGTGKPGYEGDGGKATEALLKQPFPTTGKEYPIHRQSEAVSHAASLDVHQNSSLDR